MTLSWYSRFSVEESGLSLKIKVVDKWILKNYKN